MELRFVGPELAELDRVGAEVLVAALFRDERPPRGVAGLFDWRSAGRLSRLMQEGYATGELGEVLMAPAKPSLPFDKVIFFGAGERDAFDDLVFGALIERILSTMEGLRTRSVVAQLPGRHLDVIAPERAADILLDGAADKPEHDVWTLVEDSAAQRAIGEHLLKKRRRRG
ncbi:MAG TPA: M17 family peptidase N-terminal domain-containing protein [Polyangiaceae bacterium]|nr:M17 family peptidase N-terminal domain-containing protein [Polyangiaceae bacterium]